MGTVSRCFSINRHVIKIKEYLNMKFPMLLLLALSVARTGAVGAYVSSIVAAGGTLLASDGSSSSQWTLPSGQTIDADDCWQDGSGPCANGNCLDNDGRRGIPIKETTVSCKFF